MNETTFLSTFPRQLRFWTFHCCLNALPSLCIALFGMRLWDKPMAVAAMVGAIATFILLYATLTSLSGPLADANHVISRSLRLGARIRGGISVLSLPFIWLPTPFLIPDFWCGILAINIFNHLAPHVGYTSAFGGVAPSEAGSRFFAVYTVTLLEGFILSFVLLLISYFAILFLQSRDRRASYQAACPRPANPT